MPPHILLVEDDKTTAAFYAAFIRANGYRLTICHTGQDALDQLMASQEFDLMLLDLGLPDISGWQVLQYAKSNQKLRYMPVLVVTATDDKSSFLQALQQGAEDYIIKPVDVESFLSRIEVMLRIRGFYKELGYKSLQLTPTQPKPRLRRHLEKNMGTTWAIQSLGNELERLVDHEATVLLEGEAGSGKKLVAGIIHRFSPRRNGPMVVLRCGMKAETKFLSALLGHEHPHKPGALEKAAGGTLLLEDIHLMSPLAQMTILQVIQNQHFKRLGGEENIPADIRILVSTSGNLKHMVDDNLFREDLFYRLNVVSLHIPGLSERLEDIPLLTQNYLGKRFARLKRAAPTLTLAAIKALQNHHWEENVRELFSVLEYASLMYRGKSIDDEHLPLHVNNRPAGALAPITNTLAEQERMLIMETLERFGGNKSRAARELGISRSTLYNKIAEME